MEKLWSSIVGTCVAGVSWGLPLFLLLREMDLDKKALADKSSGTQ
ncbi:MAG: DUF2834 domain-containing protein [Proteobacteria bacterium]|nr:DUF2834 domain-containing protein [Pseudomonadota bacterium]